MVFSSNIFLFIFMPLFFAVYWLLPTIGLKNICLLLGSLVFYAWGEPVFICLLAVSILVNWAFGCALGDAPKAEKAPAGEGRRLLILAIVFNLAILGSFKYAGILASALNSIAGNTLVPDPVLPFPLGLSYYTLQAIAYIVDVHRGKTDPQRDPVLFAIHIAAFPQITVGPIVRYGSIEAQLTDRHPTSSDIADGLRRFIVGLAKKVLLADVCAPLAADLFHMSPKRIGALGAWSAITSITFQLYFDFSGYSDMAIGLGKMLGFTYPENFDHPFAAESYSDLWRRWHMSLMGFFRDYVYIPLGGSRVPSVRHIANIMVVWLLTGMWHGASWNFVVWGVLNGILLIGERYLWGESFSRLPRVVRSIVCTLLFMFTYVFFSISDIAQVPAFLLALVGGFGFSGLDTPWQLCSWEYLPVLVVCIIAASPIVPWLKQRFLDPTLSDIAPTDGSPTKPGPILAFVRDAALLCLLVIAIAGVISNSFTPSMYARF